MVLSPGLSNPELGTKTNSEGRSSSSLSCKGISYQSLYSQHAFALRKIHTQTRLYDQVCTKPSNADEHSSYAYVTMFKGSQIIDKDYCFRYPGSAVLRKSKRYNLANKQVYNRTGCTWYFVTSVHWPSCPLSPSLLLFTRSFPFLPHPPRQESLVKLGHRIHSQRTVSVVIGNLESMFKLGNRTGTTRRSTWLVVYENFP